MVKQVEDLEKKAAETPTSVTGLIGMRRVDLLKTVVSMAGFAVKRPKPFVKSLGRFGKEMAAIAVGDSELKPDRRDRRFQDPTWRNNVLYKRGLQSWLAMRDSFEHWIDESGAAPIDQARAKYVLDIMADAVAPTNTLIGNPAAMKRMYETGGRSLVAGAKNFIDDMMNNGGMPSMVDRSKFKVGENLAISNGAVIYKNEMVELIQYAPTTKKVYRTPIVMVPPQINKFYIQDIVPNKSMIKYLTAQGFQVFAHSWRNPERQHSHWGLDNYVQTLINTTDVVMKITKSKEINVSGACSGGITLASFLSELAARGDKRVKSYSLMVCVLNPKKSDSEIGLFTTDEAIESVRKHSQKKGILEGDELGKAFAWMRPNDLIWNYVVNNYLLGDSPPAFDVLYWNGDATNLSAQLHSDYLDIYSDQRFLPETDFETMGHKVDLNQVKIDGFIVAGVTDHITPWKATYRSTQMFGGNMEFVLSNSGHIQSLINPPGNSRAKFYTNKTVPKTAGEWMENASENPGSWWPLWSRWLKNRSGEQKNAPKKLGTKAYPPLVKAPGEYVFT